MVLTDPIADLLTRIRNAQKARHSDVRVISSRMKRQIADILQKEGYVSKVVEEALEGKAQLCIELKYGTHGQKAIQSIERVSKPGRRVYRGHEELASMGDVITWHIVSTSRGVMTDREAARAKIGGEVLCRIS